MMYLISVFSVYTKLETVSALLLFELAKWTFRAAAEDLLGDNSDLYDEIIPFSTK